MVSRFRDRVPKRTGLIGLITDLMRVRAVQLTAAAAVLLALAQMGKMITGESMTPKTRHENRVALEEYRNDQDKPGATRDSGVFAKTDGRSKTATTTAPENEPAPPPPPLDAVLSKEPASQTEARALAKPKKTAFKDEKAPAFAETNAETTAEPSASPSSVGPM